MNTAEFYKLIRTYMYYSDLLRNAQTPAKIAYYQKHVQNLTIILDSILAEFEKNENEKNIHRD